MNETPDFFTMSQKQMMNYYDTPENHIEYSSNLDQGTQLGTAYPAPDPYRNIEYDDSTGNNYSFFNPQNKMFIPSLITQQNFINRDNVKTHLKEIREQMRTQDKVINYNPLERDIPRTAEAMATDDNIRNFLSEADTMIRRYNLPKAAADALKADIMKSHLVDYSAKKSALIQQAEDEMQQKIMRSIDPDFKAGNIGGDREGDGEGVLGEDIPKDEAGEDESKDNMGGAAAGAGDNSASNPNAPQADTSPATRPFKVEVMEAQRILAQIKRNEDSGGALAEASKAIIKKLKSSKTAQLISYISSEISPGASKLTINMKTILKSVFNVGGTLSIPEQSKMRDIIVEIKKILK